jgi:hypothetical protein
VDDREDGHGLRLPVFGDGEVVLRETLDESPVGVDDVGVNFDVINAGLKDRVLSGSGGLRSQG